MFLRRLRLVMVGCAIAAAASGCASGASWNPMLWGRDSARHQIVTMRAKADQYREQGDAAQRAGDHEAALYYWQEAAYLQTRANQTEATLH
jgi:hypothetical protein